MPLAVLVIPPILSRIIDKAVSHAVFHDTVTNYPQSLNTTCPHDKLDQSFEHPILPRSTACRSDVTPLGHTGLTKAESANTHYSSMIPCGLSGYSELARAVGQAAVVVEMNDALNCRRPFNTASRVM